MNGGKLKKEMENVIFHESWENEYWEATPTQKAIQERKNAQIAQKKREKSSENHEIR